MQREDCAAKSNSRDGCGCGNGGGGGSEMRLRGGGGSGGGFFHYFSNEIVPALDGEKGLGSSLNLFWIQYV
jgi:hypothetical protein